MPGGQFVLLPSVNTGNWIEIDVLPKMKFCWCWFDLPSHTKRFSVKLKEGKKETNHNLQVFEEELTSLKKSEKSNCVVPDGR